MVVLKASPSHRIDTWMTLLTPTRKTLTEIALVAVIVICTLLTLLITASPPRRPANRSAVNQTNSASHLASAKVRQLRHQRCNGRWATMAGMHIHQVERKQHGTRQIGTRSQLISAIRDPLTEPKHINKAPRIRPSSS